MSEQNTHGGISHTDSNSPADYLYRVSIKCLVRNENGEALVVKESGRDWWDLPGGGMNHGENIKSAIAREMKEEVNLDSDFTYRVIDVEDPGILARIAAWQIRLIFEVSPNVFKFSPGEDADQVAFMNPDIFKNSESKAERKIYGYASLASNR
jgi:ADP-ribose pyrophosphatase YjhB (NUDIX family)